MRRFLAHVLRHDLFYRWAPLIGVALWIIISLTTDIIRYNPSDPLEVASRSCAARGEWFDPRAATTVSQHDLIAEASRRAVVLLGRSESVHTDEGRWLAYTVGALHAARPALVIALDAFTRERQPTLDRWIRGELTEAEFDAAIDWSSAHDAGPDMFRPLLRFARHYRLPMVAIGTAPDFAARMPPEPWSKLPLAQYGLAEPAAAAEGYRRSLAAIYLAEKLHSGEPAERSTKPQRLAFAEELAPILINEDFQKHLLARRAQDWMIAHSIAALRDPTRKPLIVALVGRSHLEYRWGVPAQLATLGIRKPAVLLPFSGIGECALIRPGVADAVFVLDPGAKDSLSAALHLPSLSIGKTPLEPEPGHPQPAIP